MKFVRGADPWQSFVLAPPGIAVLGRQWQGRAGDVLLRTLEARLTELKGAILRGHEVIRLVMDGPRCVGLEARTSAGDFRFDAKAVVLADGGFQANRERLVAAHITSRPDKIVQRNAQTGTGACLQMAQEVGAAISDLSGFYGHVLSRDALTNDMLWPYPWLDELLKYYVMVKRDGTRFADEGRGGVQIANRIAQLPEPDETFVICDEPGWQTAGKERFLPPNPNFEKVGATVIRGSTLAEAAGKAGVDVEGLQRTIDLYNAAIGKGELQNLVPTRTALRVPAKPISIGPFYVLPAAAGITYTMGGILIDDHGRVQAKTGSPIVGLYAAGSATGGLEGGPHVGYLGGLVKASTTAYACAEGMSI
jgi:fumarate reductase flavoprotein subunit